MFLLNSRSDLVSSTASSYGSKSLHPERRTFSRSYGAILPSSFTRVLSSALVFSTRPPVSVWGTVVRSLKLRGFSWKLGIGYFPLTRSSSSSHLGLKGIRIYLNSQPTCLNLDNQRQAGLSLLRPPLGTLSFARRFRNVRLISIAYASRPRLRTRLTLSGLTFLRKP